MCIFPIKYEGDDVLRYIFPSKQKAVQTAIDIAVKDKRIERLIIFGSAITKSCGMGSDIDIAIDAPDADADEFPSIAHPFYKDVPSEIDVIHYNNIHSELLRENVNKGVCVYVKK